MYPSICQLLCQYTGEGIKEFRSRSHPSGGEVTQGNSHRDDGILEGRYRLFWPIWASLRINESLEFDTVLQQVVDCACSLTDSRYGVITTLDGSGRPLDFVTSGLAGEERRGLEDFLPEGLLVYQYLSQLEQPLRVSDYPSGCGLRTDIHRHRCVQAPRPEAVDGCRADSLMGGSHRRVSPAVGGMTRFQPATI